MCGPARALGRLLSSGRFVNLYLKLLLPSWSWGKMSVAVNAVRDAVSGLLLPGTLLPASTPLVLLGWSMGGAAALEAASRLLARQPRPVTQQSAVPSGADGRRAVVASEPEPEGAAAAAGRTTVAAGPQLGGVLTLASQAAGLYKVGNGRGRLNSVRLSVQALGAAGVQVICAHGTSDRCVNCNQTSLIVDHWAKVAKAAGVCEKFELQGEDHGCPSALRHCTAQLEKLLVLR